MAFAQGNCKAAKSPVLIFQRSCHFTGPETHTAELGVTLGEIIVSYSFIHSFIASATSSTVPDAENILENKAVLFCYKSVQSTLLNVLIKIFKIKVV